MCARNRRQLGPGESLISQVAAPLRDRLDYRRRWSARAIRRLNVVVVQVLSPCDLGGVCRLSVAIGTITLCRSNWREAIWPLRRKLRG